MTTLRTAVTSFLMMLPLATLALAQPAPGGPAGGGGTPNSGGAAAFFPIAMLGAVVVFMLLTSRSQKKREARKRTELYERMSKNDRVLTIGGVIGTIISVKDDQVIVKVDESTNTKMTFTKTAIQKILEGDQL